jgi:hypothetical protein
MSAKSAKDIKSILQEDFSEKVADEIFNMIVRLRDEKMDSNKIEEEVTLHILHHIEKDVNAAVKVRGGGSRPTKVTGPFKVGPLSKAKSKK